MNVLFLTTHSTLKDCNSPFMQYYFKRFLVLHSSEVIFSFLNKKSKQKAIEIKTAFFYSLRILKGRTFDNFFYASHIRHNFLYKLIPLSVKLVAIFLKLSMKTVQVHLIIWPTVETDSCCIHLHKSLCCFQCDCWQLVEQFLTDLHLLHCLNFLLPGTSFLPQKLQRWDLATSVATLCPSSVASEGFPYSCSLYKSDPLSHMITMLIFFSLLCLSTGVTSPFNKTSLPGPCLVTIKIIIWLTRLKLRYLLIKANWFLHSGNFSFHFSS